MGGIMKKYLKLIGVYSDSLFTEVKTEVHRDNISDIMDYVDKYESSIPKQECDNLIWVIKKQQY